MKLRKERLSIGRLVMAVLTALAAVHVVPIKASAIDLYTGNIYSVEVVSVYANPVTGTMDDVGQNPGIGNMMVQAQVQSVGYIEILEDGSIYLNTRWNQADANIYAGFEIGDGSDNGWQSVNFEVTGQYEAGTYEFMGNTFAATVTDYRIPLSTVNDVVRCTNYVEAMARECIWYCYLGGVWEYDGTWGTVTLPSMSDYSDTLGQLDEAYQEEQEQDGGQSTVVASAADSSADGSAVEGLEERKAAEAKTADDLLDEATGIGGISTEKEAAEETDEIRNSGLVLGLLIGLGAAAVIAAVILLIHRKKRKHYKELFADVDESAAPKAKETADEAPEKAPVSEGMNEAAGMNQDNAQN